jgi:hypothetical protein
MKKTSLITALALLATTTIFAQKNIYFNKNIGGQATKSTNSMVLDVPVIIHLAINGQCSRRN